MEHRTNKMIGTLEPATPMLRFGNGATTPANGKAGWEKGAIFANTADGKVYVNGGTAASAAFAALANASAIPEVTIGKGASLPASAAYVGALFVKTGEGAGLYVATGTTTPGWKAVSHAE